MSSQFPNANDTIHFDTRLKERINSFVNIPRRKNQDLNSKLWTNNNAESINNLFKVAVNWISQSTPDLIKKLYDCVDIQFLHLRGALHFTGDYALIGSQKHYRISDQLWRCKTQTEKDKIYQNFLNDRKRKRPFAEMITSTDRKYAVVNKAKATAKNQDKERGQEQKEHKRDELYLRKNNSNDVLFV